MKTDKKINNIISKEVRDLKGKSFMIMIPSPLYHPVQIDPLRPYIRKVSFTHSWGMNCSKNCVICQHEVKCICFQCLLQIKAKINCLQKICNESLGGGGTPQNDAILKGSKQLLTRPAKHKTL